MGWIYKDNKGDVQAEIAAGGWDANYGHQVDSLEAAIAALSTVITGEVASTWLAVELTLQLKAFGQSLDDVPRELFNQLLELIEDCIKNGTKGTWDIGGLGVKVGVAKYTYYAKWVGVTGWNIKSIQFQPYIGLRISGPLLTSGPVVKKEIEAPVWLAKVPISPPPSEPPANAVTRYEP